MSIEHKLGIHASPTCVMAFGDRDGAIGYLSARKKGLAYMFMMNEARFWLTVGWLSPSAPIRPPGNTLDRVAAARPPRAVTGSPSSTTPTFGGC